MELITLRNGTSEPAPLVVATTLALRTLFDREPIAFYEAVQVARNPNHKPFGNAGEKLEAGGLLQQGAMHASIRNIIQVSVEGDGFDMRLVRPSS